VIDLDLNKKLVEYRTKARITQNELGSLIGKTSSEISKYENGEDEPPLSVLKRIAKVLNISLLNLIDENNDVRKNVVFPMKMIPLYYVPVNINFGAFPDRSTAMENIPVLRPDVEFGVRVTDNNMEPEAPDGSILLVKSFPAPIDGEMIICSYGNWTYARWYNVRENGDIYLVPDNPAYKPVKIEHSVPFKISGTVVEIMKRKTPIKKFK
jgi:transcriptional regulator with XRE-family HTH domain